VLGGSPGAPANGRITFTRFDPKLGDFSIWAANPDGTHQQRLTHTPSQDNDWSPNGRRIAFDFFNKTGEHLATMDPNGRHVRQLTFKKGIQGDPKWSPNGQRITFDASPTFPDQPGFHTSIWTMRANGTGARQLTHGIFGVEPVYSPVAAGSPSGASPASTRRASSWKPSTSSTPTARTCDRSSRRSRTWNTPTGPPTAPGSPSTSPPKHRTQR
jgi:Tol biopolymer transport system component